MPRDLPDFKNPPVVEVALSVQFERLANLRTPHIGLLWSEYKAEYPKIEDQQPLESVFEDFHSEGQVRPRVTIQLSSSPPVPRCWFLNDAGTRLIQVQADRFIYNWRKGEGERDYPRYESVRDGFEKEFRKFREFISKQGLGDIKPNQADVTYVNAVYVRDVGGSHANLDKLLTLFSNTYSEPLQIEMETVSMSARLLIKNDEGKPEARLHITIDPVFTVFDTQPIFLLKLTARGKPKGESTADVIDFFNLGRVWIVKGFTSITTKHMHEQWERIDNQ
jgi:uncharacterized protein (TIGR04255 family)